MNSSHAPAPTPACPLCGGAMVVARPYATTRPLYWLGKTMLWLGFILFVFTACYTVWFIYGDYKRMLGGGGAVSVATGVFNATMMLLVIALGGLLSLRRHVWQCGACGHTAPRA